MSSEDCAPSMSPLAHALPAVSVSGDPFAGKGFGKGRFGKGGFGKGTDS